MLQGDETPDFKKQFNPVTCNEKNEAGYEKGVDSEGPEKPFHEE